MFEYRFGILVSLLLYLHDARAGMATESPKHLVLPQSMHSVLGRVPVGQSQRIRQMNQCPLDVALAVCLSGQLLAGDAASMIQGWGGKVGGEAAPAVAGSAVGDGDQVAADGGDASSLYRTEFDRGC
jgi:hypothetical protein